MSIQQRHEQAVDSLISNYEDCITLAYLCQVLYERIQCPCRSIEEYEAILERLAEIVRRRKLIDIPDCEPLRSFDAHCFMVFTDNLLSVPDGHGAFAGPAMEYISLCISEALAGLCRMSEITRELIIDCKASIGRITKSELLPAQAGTVESAAGDSEAGDWITITVAVKRYYVSKTTIRDACRVGRIASRQKEKRCLIYVRESEISANWDKK